MYESGWLDVALPPCGWCYDVCTSYVCTAQNDRKSFVWSSGSSEKCPKRGQFIHSTILSIPNREIERAKPPNCHYELCDPHCHLVV
jgi:hypothetical protein